MRTQERLNDHQASFLDFLKQVKSLKDSISVIKQTMISKNRLNELKLSVTNEMRKELTPFLERNEEEKKLKEDFDQMKESLEKTQLRITIENKKMS